jgi:DNA replication and repair protein RecF
VSGRIVRHSAEKFQLFAQKLSSGDQTIPIGLERHAQGDIKIRIAGQDAQSAADLANLTPVQLVNSSCFNLLDGGPLFRRKYLDWGIFYLNSDFLRVWRDVAQILKQRNAALRSRRPKQELSAWTEELVAKAAVLDQMRQAYVDLLIPLLRETVADLVTIPELELDYQPGWDQTLAYADVLHAALDKDIHLGHTQYGPHRADFKIKTRRIQAKDILSRGQQKLFVCAMILAQGALLNRHANKQPIYLIDDLPAELDTTSRANLIGLLSRQNTQIFVTAVERDGLGEALLRLPRKMFHVEHGEITEVT